MSFLELHSSRLWACATQPFKELSVFPASRKAPLLEKKPLSVIHPENVPSIMRLHDFPKDFSLYEYAGAMLDVIPGKNAKGKIVRRPALVAKMVRRYVMQDADALVEMEMTSSVGDLRKGRHPDAAAIAAALTTYYEEKVINKEPIVREQKQASVSVSKTKPITAFFMPFKEASVL